METASFKIWTRVAESTTNDDNLYATSATICVKISTGNINWDTMIIFCYCIYQSHDTRGPQTIKWNHIIVYKLELGIFKNHTIVSELIDF